MPSKKNRNNYFWHVQLVSFQIYKFRYIYYGSIRIEVRREKTDLKVCVVAHPSFSRILTF